MLSYPCLTASILRFTLSLAFVVSTLVHAQQIPDGGRLLEQLKPPPELPERSTPQLKNETPSATVQTESADTPRIRVDRLNIKGAEVIPATELHALVADAEGRELSLAQLQALTERISAHYRARGYPLSHAYVPAQEVRDGLVEIVVVEVRLNAVNIDNAAGVRGMALAPLERIDTSRVLENASLERALLLLSEVPGIAVSSTIRPGAQSGTSDLDVHVTPGKRYDGSVDVDNAGSRTSGRYRLGAQLNLNNPLNIGDLLSLRALTSNHDLRYLVGSWQAPVNSLGTVAGGSLSTLNYGLGDNLAQLDASGHVHAGGVYLKHPLVRSYRRNLSALLRYDRLLLEDRIGAVSTRINKRISAWSAGLSGDFLDGFNGGAQTSGSLSHTHGRLDLDSDSNVVDAASARSAGDFGKVEWSLQRLAERLQLQLLGNGQWASKNLDSSQKMVLGGPSSVRAYPSGEAAGDEGYFLSAEAQYALRLSWPGIWRATLFYDHGHVTINRDPWTNANNGRTLRGFGVGMLVTDAAGWLARVSLAWKRGEAPQTDSDHSPRMWLQARRHF
jgi:hemolysin activation/secretion protein